MSAIPVPTLYAAHHRPPSTPTTASRASPVIYSSRWSSVRSSRSTNGYRNVLPRILLCVYPAPICRRRRQLHCLPTLPMVLLLQQLPTIKATAAVQLMRSTIAMMNHCRHRHQKSYLLPPLLRPHHVTGVNCPSRK